METIILASSSPRRQELLKLIGVSYRAAPSRIDEVFDPSENPAEVVLRLSHKKLDVFLDNERSVGCHWVMAADTIVAHDHKIYGKPQSRDEAEEILKKLSGSVHTVYTGFAIFNRKENKTVDCVDTTRVEFMKFSDEDLNWYLDHGEWQDVAGGYRVQGVAQCFIKRIEGSISNVMGLPLHKFYAILKELGYQL